MKTKEEIDELAEKEFDNIDKPTRSGKDKHSYLLGFSEGYTQFQEDMAKELYEFGKLVLDTFHSEGRTHSGKARLAIIKFDEWFNSLNKQDNENTI